MILPLTGACRKRQQLFPTEVILLEGALILTQPKIHAITHGKRIFRS